MQENNLTKLPLYTARIGIVFYFYGISESKKERIKEVFLSFIKLTKYSFKYYSTLGNLKKIKNEVCTLFDNHLNKYQDFSDVLNIYFTDDEVDKIGNISFEIHLSCNDDEILYPSYIYCELPIIELENVLAYIKKSFSLLDCDYACVNQVISNNPHISKSFTPSMKELEKTSIYSNAFSVYTNPSFIRHLRLENNLKEFAGIDGINFIQIYSSYYYKYLRTFIEIAQNKGLLLLNLEKNHVITQLPYNEFIYEERDDAVKTYKELFNIFKPIIINFDKPVGFWKKDNWSKWRNRFYDEPMLFEKDRLRQMQEMFLNKGINYTETIVIEDKTENTKDNTSNEYLEMYIGEFIEKYSLKNELISSDVAWKRYNELYDKQANNNTIPIMIDGGYDANLNMIDTVDFKDVEQNKSLNDIFNTALIEEYQDEFDDTVKKLVKKNTDDKCEFCGDGEVVIVKLKIKYPYEVFRKIPFGGFNDCPTPEEHYQIAKYWYEEYGAIPVIIGKDYIQYYVEKPIEDINTLKKVVSEQCCYCPLEGQTVKEFAQTIYKSNFWYFWWD